jgi:hypothetical protein
LSSFGDATVAVITMLMLIDGDLTRKSLPSNVSSMRDVEGALGRIVSDARADECLRRAAYARFRPRRRGSPCGPTGR